MTHWTAIGLRGSSAPHQIYISNEFPRDFVDQSQRAHVMIFPRSFVDLYAHRTSIVTIRGLLYTKEMTFEGKDGSTSILRGLTNGLARMNVKDNVRWMGTNGSKG